MEKVYIFLLIFVVININAQEKDEWYVNTNEYYFGIYLPINYIELLEKTKNNYTSLNNNKNYHDILIVEKNRIASNSQFHDGYAIKNEEAKYFKFYEENKIKYIIDQNNIKYKCISNTTENYYEIVCNFVAKIIFNGINEVKIINNEINISKIGKQNYKINLDPVLIDGNANLILVNYGLDEWIYLEITNNEYIFYEMERDDFLGIKKTNKIRYKIIP
jgi:hypothetical protein